MDQLEYLALLFNDCGFDTAKARAAWMTREFNRPVKFADELDSHERSLAITALKDIKYGKQERSRSARSRRDWEDQD
jgi:hypothetical protein